MLPSGVEIETLADESTTLPLSHPILIKKFVFLYFFVKNV